MQFFVDFSSFTGKINKEFFSDVTARKQLFRIQVKSLYPSPSSISLYYNRPFEQYYAQINVKSVLRHLRSYLDNDRNFTSSMNETSWCLISNVGLNFTIDSWRRGELLWEQGQKQSCPSLSICNSFGRGLCLDRSGFHIGRFPMFRSSLCCFVDNRTRLSVCVRALLSLRVS